jgi:hypothetical protein
MALSGLGLLAFAIWLAPEGGQLQGPLAGSEPSLLEGWWNAGQGKGFLWGGITPQPPTVESLAVNRLISTRARPGTWNEEEIRDLSSFILTKSEEFKVSPFLVLSLIDVESRYEPTAISRRGAVGMMQLLPGTAEEMAEDSGMSWRPSLLTDPKINIELGLRYMDQLRKRFKSEARALTAYNMGPAALQEKLELGQDISLTYFRLVKSRMHYYHREARLSPARSRLWANAWL